MSATGPAVAGGPNSKPPGDPIVKVGGTALVGPSVAPFREGWVQGYKAACEDNGLDVPTDGEAAAAARGRVPA